MERNYVTVTLCICDSQKTVGAYHCFSGIFIIVRNPAIKKIYELFSTVVAKLIFCFPAQLINN